MRHLRWALAGLLLAISVLVAIPRAAHARNCTFVLGFATLHNMIPLPTPPTTRTPAQPQPWFLKLADNSTCRYFINAHNDITGLADGQLINYHCSSGWDLLNLPRRDTVWTIMAVLRASDYTVLHSATTEIAVAWRTTRASALLEVRDTAPTR